MIIKANQRGHARELARHLLNVHDNEHVEIHAINGLVSDDPTEALAEMEAVARGTRCTQPLFSVSLSPPRDANVPIAAFEDAIHRIAQKNGLDDQPHVIVFHEKEGRRHAHVVFSRIDVEEMKAINLPFYKNKCMEVSVDLFLEHDWKLPQGFIDRELRNPLNFSMEQWQQATRLGDDPRLIRQALRDAYEQSDSRTAFEAALQEHGFYLAQGDRRGFVVVDWRSQIYSLSKWSGHPKKELKAKLGDPAQLPSVQSIMGSIDQRLETRINDFANILVSKHQQHFSPLFAQKQSMTDQHREERERLEREQEERRIEEARQQQERFAKGLKGLWHRLTGKHSQTRRQNELDAERLAQDQAQEKFKLTAQQLTERKVLQEKLGQAEKQHQENIENIRRGVFKRLPDEQVQKFLPEFEQKLEQTQTYDMEM